MEICYQLSSKKGILYNKIQVSTVGVAVKWSQFLVIMMTL